jgi:micrococcal nuclease
MRRIPSFLFRSVIGILALWGAWSLLAPNLNPGQTSLPMKASQGPKAPATASNSAPIPDVDRVVQVIDGDTVRLAMGREVRMTGIQAPKLPLGRKGFRKWPLADAAKQHLEDLVLGQQVQIQPGESPQDRWGRILAQLYNEQDIWLQEAMLEEGLARVYTFADNARHADALYAAEARARKAGKGIWRLGYYAVRTPLQAAGHVDTFQLVEGRIVELANVRGRVYLNFGEDYQTDFTVSIAAPVRRAFETAGIDLMALQGKGVRVRGWLRDWNGPLIELTHPAQLELLDT